MEMYSNPSEYIEYLKRTLIIKNIGEYQHISTRKREQMLKIGLEYEFASDNARISADDHAEIIVQYWKNIGINVENAYDGSLSDYGREMKFPPMTESAYNALSFAFIKTFQMSQANGYVDTRNRSGGHLHVSIKALGNEMSKRLHNMRRLVDWFYANKEQIERFAMRGNSDWARFVRWSDDYLDDTSSYARYRAVNFFTNNHRYRNAKTFEIRIFAGYRNAEQLLANVQLVKMITNSLNGATARVLENYDLNALIFANRRNAPNAFNHWLAVNLTR